MNAIFFDFDGTLVDSRADLAETVNHTRRDLGLAEISLAEVISHIGLGARRLLEDSIPERPGETDMLLDRFLGHYNEHLLDHCELYPGVRETLESLREAGWLLGINTAKPRFAVDKVLAHFGMAGLFGNAIVAGGDSPEMKPSAVPLLECARRMDHAVTPDDWMVGDNWTDMECAVNASVHGAFCAFGFGQLRDSACDATLRQFSDILSVI